MIFEKHGRIKIWLISLTISAIGLVVLMALSVTSGAADIPLDTVWRAIARFDPMDSKQLLVRDMRIPRALSGALIGAALAVAGAIMQGMTRNPLADSGLMGLNAGAGLFLALALVLLKDVSYYGIIWLTFLGAALGAGCVSLLRTLIPGGEQPIKLVLAGATISTLFSAVSQAIAITTNSSQSILFWTMGSVSGTTWNQLRAAGPFLILCVLLAVIISRDISIMNMGEEVAKGLGINLKRTRRIGTLAVVILSGASYALCGSISFVGIIIPHFVRFQVGPDYRLVIPLSALQGGLLVVLADYLAKTIDRPAEFPLGALISLVGVPVFLYYARKEKVGK